jgi:hypothetical protein
MSYIQMSSRDLIPKLEKVIYEIEQKREKQKQKVVKEIESTKKGWFSDECWTFKEYMQKVDFFDSSAMRYSLASTYAWGEYNDAKTLMTLACNADEVFVSDKHARLIK